MSGLATHIKRELHGAWRLAALLLALPIVFCVVTDDVGSRTVCLLCFLIAVVGFGIDLIAADRRGRGLGLVQRLPAGQVPVYAAKLIVLTGFVLATLAYADLCVSWLRGPEGEEPFAAFLGLLPMALATCSVALAASAIAGRVAVALLVFVLVICGAVLAGQCLEGWLFTEDELKFFSESGWQPWMPYDSGTDSFWWVLAGAGLLASLSSFVLGSKRSDARLAPSASCCAGFVLVLGVTTSVERYQDHSYWTSWTAPVRVIGSAAVSQDERSALLLDSEHGYVRVDLTSGCVERMPPPWFCSIDDSLQPTAGACRDRVVLKGYNDSYGIYSFEQRRVVWKAAGETAREALRAKLLERHELAARVAREGGWEIVHRPDATSFVLMKKHEDGLRLWADMCARTQRISLLHNDSWDISLRSATHALSVNNGARHVIARESPSMVLAKPLSLHARYAPLWFDNNGRLLVKGPAGLSLFVLSSGEFRAVRADDQGRAALDSAWAIEPRPWRDRLLLLTRGNGYIVYDPETEAARFYSVGSAIRGLVATGGDRIYLITERGLERAVVGEDGSELLYPRD